MDTASEQQLPVTVPESELSSSMQPTDTIDSNTENSVVNEPKLEDIQKNEVTPTAISESPEENGAVTLEERIENKDAPQPERQLEEAKKGSKFSYRDYSHIESTHSQSGALSPNSSAIRVQKLPAKLNAMLSSPGYQNTISWMPHGRSWKVHNPHAFVEEVIPKYFEYTNYNSFVRLVNAWGFRRITKGPDRNSYYHELFLRGMPHLHTKMHRLTANEKKIPVDTEDEPEFYKISTLCPLPPSTPNHPTNVGMGKGIALAPLPHRQARNPLQFQKQMFAKQHAAMAGKFSSMLGGGGMPGVMLPYNDPLVRMPGMHSNMTMQAAAAQLEEEEFALAAAGIGGSVGNGAGGSSIMPSVYQHRADLFAAQEMRLRERRLYLAGAGGGPAPGGLGGLQGYGGSGGISRLARGGMMHQPLVGSMAGMMGGEDILSLNDPSIAGIGGITPAMMASLQQQAQGGTSFGKRF